MKNLILIFVGLFLWGCSDGDVIVKDFNFSNSELKTCGATGDYVFFKENVQNFESLSLRLKTPNDIYENEETHIFQLNTSDIYVNYRRYDGKLGANYFCNSVPPTTPLIIEDYKATSGQAIVMVTFEFEDLSKSAIDKTSTRDNLNMRRKLFKHVEIVLKDLVLVKGDEQIIMETIDFGRIKKAQTIEI